MDPLRHVLDNVFCLDANSQAGLKQFEVNDLVDLLSIEPRIDLQGEYVIGISTVSAGYPHHLSPVTIRKFETLKLWFASQTKPDADSINWFALTSEIFRQFSLGLTINRMVKTKTNHICNSSTNLHSIQLQQRTSIIPKQHQTLFK